MHLFFSIALYLHLAMKAYIFHILLEFVSLFLTHNARLTEQIFDGDFCACFCTKGDSGNLSGAAVC